MTLRAIDLCCGAGGWAAAARDLPIEWVAVVDLAPDCIATWRTNHLAEHPECATIVGDLTDPQVVDHVCEVADKAADLVVGGIPCEQISQARRASAAEPDWETFHGLIDACLEVVRRVQPDWWCIEGVIQIRDHLPGQLFAGVGDYDVRVIDAADYGPQKRRRAFVGRFPPPQPPSELRHNWTELLDRGPHRTIADADTYARHIFGVDGEYHCRSADHDMRVLEPTRAAPTITAQWDQGGTGTRKYMVADEPPYEADYRPARTAAEVTEPSRVRILTWQEAARLQGFPEDYLFATAMTRTREMVARAIPIQVGRAILEGICREAGVARLTTLDQ